MYIAHANSHISTGQETIEGMSGFAFVFLQLLHLSTSLKSLPPTLKLHFFTHAPFSTSPHPSPSPTFDQPGKEAAVANEGLPLQGVPVHVLQLALLGTRVPAGE